MSNKNSAFLCVVKLSSKYLHLNDASQFEVQRTVVSRNV